MTGAGPSGLASAKAILDVGLVPRVFETSATLGGLWSTESKLCRPTMRTNLSKHTDCFSDLAWPEDAPTFPHAWQVGQYLCAYAEKFIPDGVITFNCKVTSVERSADSSQWKVTWFTNGKQLSEEFEFMIVACGFFSEPFVPEIPGLDTFKGSVVHSSAFTSPEVYKDKHLAIIGGSLSSVEVAEYVAPYAASIHHIIPRPFWVIPKYLPLDPDDPSTTFLPLDLVLYRRFPPPSDGGDMSLQARWRKVNENLRSLCGGLGDVPEMNVDMDMPPYAAVSDMYANYVRSGHITLYSGHLSSISGSILAVDPSPKHPLPDDITDIIFASGFRPSSSSHIFPPSLLSDLNFSETDHFLPILLHRATLHPSLPNAAFVGHYRGPYWGVIELQARWCAGLFSGALTWPSREEMKQGIAAEKRMRDMRPRPQWPRGDYVNFGSDLAVTLGLTLPPVNTKTSKRSLTPNDVFVPSHFVKPAWLQQFRSHESAIPSLLDSLNTTLIQSANSGLFVAAAIFRSLHGHWSLSRFYASRRPEYPSGPSVGTAEFSPRKASAKPSSATSLGAKIEYLYSETTTLTTSSGLQLQGTQQYIYTYDEGNDQLEVFFAKREEGFALDYLFHQVHLVSKPDPAGKRAPWHATSSHFCSPDNYKVTYEFYFRGSDLDKWKIEYDVNGPKKDYTMQTWYTRPVNKRSRAEGPITLQDNPPL